MSAGRMHVDEVYTDGSLVARLLAMQFPQWAELPIDPVASAGTDNALYRVGDEMVARLPRIHWAAGQVEKEQQWLPRLAPFLPLSIPIPLAKGKPGERYPFPWSIYRWIEGENTSIERIADPRRAVMDLAHFIASLQQINAADGPPPGMHNSSRGEPLAARNLRTRDAIISLRGAFDVDAMSEAWDAALKAPVWREEPVWIHGDLQGGNLLARQGRLRAVIDFGCLGVGDPACDVMAAWTFLSADTRNIFRAALQVDDATWARGRGWALSVGAIALPYYQNSNPILAGIARRAINEVLADHQHSGNDRSYSTLPLPASDKA